MGSKTKKLGKRVHKKTAKRAAAWPFSSSTPLLRPEVRGTSPPYLVYLDKSGNEVSKNDMLEGKYGPLPSLESLKTSNPTIYNTLKEQRGDPSEESGRWTSKTFTPKERSENQLMGYQQNPFKPTRSPTTFIYGPDGSKKPYDVRPPPPPPLGGKKKRRQRNSSVRRRT
jgi:hypothetical protein